MLALVVKPSPQRRLFSPVVSSCPRHLAAPSSLSTGYPTLDYCIGAAYFPYLFAAFNYILLTNVQRELRVVQPPQREDDAPLSRRIAWATKLSADSAEHTSRVARFRRLVRAAAAAALLFEAANLYTSARIPALYAGGPHFAAQGWAARYLAVWAWVVPVAVLSELGHALSAAGAAALGDWPPIQGPGVPRARVERAQFLGPRVAPEHASVPLHIRLVAHRMLRLARDAAASAYVQLYAAFFVSGVAHHLPEYTALRRWGGGAKRFFVLQAGAMMLEDGVQAAGRRLGMAAS